MNNPSDPIQDDRVTELLLQWEQLRKEGRNPSAEELCSGHPELVPLVAQGIDALQAMERILTTKEVVSTHDTHDRSDAVLLSKGTVTTLSRYRVARFHARGGRSEVHVARDEELGRDVAVKFIRPQFAGDTISRDRFQREAEITSCLDHPGVVPVYGTGRDDRGNPFYCMRFVEGKTLREAIDAFHVGDDLKQEAGWRQPAFRKLLGHFIDACQTIAYAHSRGIVHRDIKPENIVLGAYGETQVIDWGLAKVASTESTGHEEETETVAELPAGGADLPGGGAHDSLTQFGMVLGTPAYMSPEQASGSGKIGTASDLYNLGATFYTLLVGRPPFHGATAPDVIRHAERGEFVTPRQTNRRISPALEAICLKAMAHDPSERYASAADLTADVERYLADEPVTAYAEPWHERIGRWSRRYRALMRAAVISLIIISGVSSTAAVMVNHQRTVAQTALAGERKGPSGRIKRPPANGGCAGLSGGCIPSPRSGC